MITSKLPASVLADLLSIRFGDASLEELLGRYVEVAKATHIAVAISNAVTYTDSARVASGVPRVWAWSLRCPPWK